MSYVDLWLSHVSLVVQVDNKPFYNIIIVGVSSTRRDLLLYKLNNDFLKHVEDCKDVYNAYTRMLHEIPFRILASYFHDMKEEPIRSKRITKPAVIEVKNDKNVCYGVRIHGY